MADDMVKRLRSVECTAGCGSMQVCVCSYAMDAADRLESLEAERDVLRKWDDHFRAACGYKRDGRPSPECFDEWLAKVFLERASLGAALQAADELARAMQREEDCFGLPDFMQAALASYRKARGGEP